ncbi:MAG TPA: OB-fold domain-containing protein [Paracoccus sp. (in: a-proteobacteria)]|uniref:Zn-ribbon domain-containing OB-fold protein n=1 Tax=Paracoccus sp. TaxID=267 RepID=UPI002CB743A0|nr:OB-fold domain-containing protein [Paracoccus sp. (in: a-proteobacteria)]HWL58968.1 OB-fold domain-containing protein [Paracoccus sp. (in: a-proteobacteria)]
MNIIETSPLQQWQDHLRAGRLAYQFSPDAGRAVFYPRLVCPHGGRAPLEWRISAGRGSVHSISRVHPVKGEPYPVALIDLDEGFRMMSTVEGARGEPDEIGRRVRLSLRPSAADGAPPLPAFEWEEQE